MKNLKIYRKGKEYFVVDLSFPNKARRHQTVISLRKDIRHFKQFGILPYSKENLN